MVRVGGDADDVVLRNTVVRTDARDLELLPKLMNTICMLIAWTESNDPDVKKGNIQKRDAFFNPDTHTTPDITHFKSHWKTVRRLEPCPAFRLSMDHHLKEPVLLPRATATTPQENTAATS
ncbi:unnamed protein product [Menidia menidia]|uniref:(Atlantic silverside) hypothetical protein n=1 Tax=Menidia menidia TaxID=238744 RepID=A0A8S4AA58_9TELE|nr:unnamed protein product [Menidia menidia]